VVGSSYEPGQWRRLGSVSTFTAEYLHNDMLGTLRQTTNAGGTSSGSDVFNAFGERIAGSADRGLNEVPPIEIVAANQSCLRWTHE